MKQFIRSICKSIVKLYVNGKAKISNGIKEMKIRYYSKDNYRDLAPIDNISNGEEYLEALHWAIKNKRIKNIALTGPYGSGKSSIINSYLKRHPVIKVKHLRISMATFVESGLSKNGKSTKIHVEPELI